MSKNFDIFVSYRRKGGHDTAKLLYDRLRLDGYSVSFDIDTLEKGDFFNELENRIKDCKDFLLILSPGAFDRFFDSSYDPEDDWMRREISCALKTKKNIIPIVLDGFVFPTQTLPDEVKDVIRINAIDLSHKHFESVYAKMKKTFLTSKPYWIVEHKKKIIYSIAVAFLVFAVCLFFVISESSKKKDLELQKAKIAAQQADSIRIAREVELAHIDELRRIDSIRTAEETELIRIADSIRITKEIELMLTEDSIKKATLSEAATTSKSSKKTLHWSGSNDAIGQAIFKKISPAGVKKTKCSGNGIKIIPEKVTCRKDAMSETSCFYSPKLTLTDCKGKLISFLGTSEIFKTAPRIDEKTAKEELAKELLKTNFSDWVSVLREEGK